MIDVHIMNKTYAVTEEEAVKAGREWEKRLMPDVVSSINAGSMDDPKNAVKLLEAAWKRVPLVTADLAVTIEGFADGHKPPKPKKPPAYEKLDIADAHLLREDAKFVEKVHGIKVLGTTNMFKDVNLELPSFLPDKEIVARYMHSVFPDASYTTPDASKPAHVSMSLYDLKDACAKMFRPLSHRTWPDRERSQRRPLEVEYGRMMGVALAIDENASAKEGQSLKETIKDLKQRRRIEFKELWRDGLLHIPVKDTESGLWNFVNKAQEAGAFTPDDLGITRLVDGSGYDIAMTARGVHKLNLMAMDGMKNEKGDVIIPSLFSPENIKARDAYQQKQRINHIMGEIDTCTAEYVARTPHAGMAYDKETMVAALGKSFDMLNENRYWTALEKSQLASNANHIRDDLRTGMTDLHELLTTKELNQDQMRWLVNESLYAPLIRTTGHLMSVVQDTTTKPGFDNGAKAFQQAFGLTRLSMKPTDAEGKEASYYLRSQQGKAGLGEQIKSNAFMGLRPIIHSVDLAFEKPLLVGGAVAGIAAYSHMVPKKYSIPVMLNKVVHDTMEGLGLHSHDKGNDVFRITEKVKLLEKNQPINFKAGYKTGWAACAGTLAMGFIMFNLVEDVIVHMPLALVSVGVGAAGGATGRKVVKPIIDDLGDIAGKYVPEPVREAFMDDYRTAKAVLANSSFGNMKDGFVAFSRDADQLGVVASTFGLLQKTNHWADKVKHASGPDKNHATAPTTPTMR